MDKQGRRRTTPRRTCAVPTRRRQVRRTVATCPRCPARSSSVDAGSRASSRPPSAVTITGRCRTATSPPSILAAARPAARWPAAAAGPGPGAEHLRVVAGGLQLFTRPGGRTTLGADLGVADASTDASTPRAPARPALPPPRPPRALPRPAAPAPPPSRSPPPRPRHRARRAPTRTGRRVRAPVAGRDGEHLGAHRALPAAARRAVRLVVRARPPRPRSSPQIADFPASADRLPPRPGRRPAPSGRTCWPPPRSAAPVTSGPGRPLRWRRADRRPGRQGDRRYEPEALRCPAPIQPDRHRLQAIVAEFALTVTCAPPSPRMRWARPACPPTDLLAGSPR